MAVPATHMHMSTHIDQWEAQIMPSKVHRTRGQRRMTMLTVIRMITTTTITTTQPERAAAS
jgi:hypothetical protein